MLAYYGRDVQEAPENLTVKQAVRSLFGLTVIKGNRVCRVFSIFAPHLTEVCIDILPTPLVQLCTANLFSKTRDADDITGFQVLGQEITACFGHILKLKSWRKHQIDGLNGT